MSGLDKVSVAVSVVMGSARVPLEVFLGFGCGARVPLEGADGEEVVLYVENLPIARGRLRSVAGERLTVEIRTILAEQSTLAPLAA